MINENGIRPVLKDPNILSDEFIIDGERIITPWGDVWTEDDAWYQSEKEKLIMKSRGGRGGRGGKGGRGGRGNASGGDLSEICDEVYPDDGRVGYDWGHHSDNASQGQPLHEDSAGGSSGFWGGIFGGDK